jgi:Ca-activated chloride channel family protein
MRLSPSPLIVLLLAVTSALLAACGGDSGSGVSFGGVQDIGQFREVIEEGRVPGESTLDANGFFNEHHIPLPPAGCGQALCLHAMLAVHRDWIYRDYQAVLQIAMSSPIDTETLVRPPLNLVVVVDTSASMKEDERLERVREGLHLLIDGLLPEDRLGLVTYGTEATVIADVQGDLDKAGAHAAVDAVVAEGSTNFHDGLFAGLQMAAKAYSAARQNRLIMLSDGLPTRGITDADDILTMAEPFISKGIAVTTVGVGFDYDSALMKQLAERGAGNFYYIESADAVKEIFTEELSYFVTPIALDLDIEVRAGPSYKLGEVVGAKGWTVDGSAGKIHVPAVFLASRTGEGVGGGENPDGRRGGGSAIFIQMLPTEATTEVESRVGEIRMKYRRVDTGELFEQTVNAVSPFPAGIAGEDVFLTHEAMAKSYAMYNLFLGLRGATRLARCHLDCGGWLLERLREVALLWNAQKNDEDIKADIDLTTALLENVKAALEENRYGREPPPVGRDICAACRDGGCCGADDVCSASGGTRRTSEPVRPSAMLLFLLPIALAARSAARARARRSPR